MPQKTKVNALMEQHKITRTAANNMLRKRGNGTKEKDGTRKFKRKTINK